MKLASLLVSAALLASPLAHANLVQNGDFNQGLDNWTLTAAQSGSLVRIFTSPTTSFAFGGLDVNYYDSISQNLNTIAGQAYALTFSANNNAYTYQNFFSVSAGNKVLASFYDSPISINSSNSYIFKATSSNTLLTFSGYNVPSWTRINNIAVSPVPEPETYALMGMGLLAVTLKLRKKKQGQSSAALPV